MEYQLRKIGVTLLFVFANLALPPIGWAAPILLQNDLAEAEEIHSLSCDNDRRIDGNQFPGCKRVYAHGGSVVFNTSVQNHTASLMAGCFDIANLNIVDNFSMLLATYEVQYEAMAMANYHTNFTLQTSFTGELLIGFELMPPDTHPSLIIGWRDETTTQQFQSVSLNNRESVYGFEVVLTGLLNPVGAPDIHTTVVGVSSKIASHSDNNLGSHITHAQLEHSSFGGTVYNGSLLELAPPDLSSRLPGGYINIVLPEDEDYHSQGNLLNFCDSLIPSN